MQLLLVLHGSGKICSEDSSTDVEAGDIVSIRPGLIHWFTDCVALQMIACDFFPRSIRKRVGMAIDSKALSILLGASPVHKHSIALDKFRSIAALVAASQVKEEMGNVGRLLLLLETIVEHAKNPLSSVHPAVFEVVQHFDESVAKDWSLPEIATEVDLDPSYLARLFSINLNAPPLAYLSILRAEEALLRVIGEPTAFAAIGEGVGWHDPNYFSRRFRHHFGISPTSFRERFQVQAD